MTRKGSERHATGRVVEEMLVGEMPGPARDPFEVMIAIAQRNTNYSKAQKLALLSLHAIPELAPVEKAARNMPGILDALQSMNLAGRLQHISSVSELMDELFTGGNLLAVY
ncbi:MAG: hypothetical protein Q8P68_01410 [Candidatus Peregrinibacteria bacterium]|nr:hypothetical protein [Candidatus Peregrinibacteria bacterium]MDZ4245236.1 hypothetical protein [Candidatus Gracilibacteria bacterium]